jgi:hypothetical protein
VGAVVLLWGVVGLLDVRKRQREFRDWRQRRRAPKSPHEKEPNIGRPPDRNPLFRDREADLERLAVQLGQHKRVDLSGLGGVGKTQLAIEYLHRQRELSRYPDGIFWLRGDTDATLRADFVALAWLPPLNLKERHLPEQERVIVAVTDRLRDHEEWLLVVDNLDRGSVSELRRLWPAV